MPIFEYHCLTCGIDFELLIYANSEDPICPECSATGPRKKFSVFGMKTDAGRFVSSAGSSCGGCASHNCSGCNH